VTFALVPVRSRWTRSCVVQFVCLLGSTSRDAVCPVSAVPPPPIEPSGRVRVPPGVDRRLWVLPSGLYRGDPLGRPVAFRWWVLPYPPISRLYPWERRQHCHKKPEEEERRSCPQARFIESIELIEEGPDNLGTDRENKKEDDIVKPRILASRRHTRIVVAAPIHLA